MKPAEQERLIKKAITEVFIGVDKKALANIFHDIKHAYNDHRRHHHGMLHIAEMIAESEKHEITNRRAFLAAIIFHDFVYKAERYDKSTYKGISNEEESARECARYLKHYGQHDIIDRSCALIRMTEDHKAPEGDHEAWLFIDIDMSVIGAPPKRYQKYAHDILSEFLHVFRLKEYMFGRFGFLNAKLDAKVPIFKTPQYAHLEPAARDNMRWEQENLPAMYESRKGSNGQQFTML